MSPVGIAITLENPGPTRAGSSEQAALATHVPVFAIHVSNAPGSKLKCTLERRQMDGFRWWSDVELTSWGLDFGQMERRWSAF